MQSFRILARLTAVIFLLASASCSGTGDGGEDLKLDDELYGFFLGERKSDIFERARNRVEWKQIPNPRRECRGDLYILPGTLDGSPDVEKVRLAFLDGYLTEIIVYFKDTGVSRLERLKKELERRYGARATFPDGTVETAYKTYRIPGPGMSVTVRRITKKPTTELYVQYLHDELHRRLIERKKEMGL